MRLSQDYAIAAGGLHHLNAVYKFDGGEFVRGTLIPFLRELAAHPSLRTFELGCITFSGPALPDYTRLERLVLLVVESGAWAADALAKGTRWRPALADLPLRNIDVLLATDPFRRLRRVSITVYCRCHGSSDTDSEDEDEAEDEDDAIPSTEDAGDIEAMMDGSSGEDSHGVWFEQ
ncbi:hypothetical protein TRAPUB_7329 [Trametes pubescens]|uniref:Uncharacterized protein n=1 Tax=Trametes pubescens TaxID=154538 RepID=A0A1M2V3S3_TRAPU|nr:hypothetical protein TRAPUB_7329 [Trametes pubescens]